MSFPCSANVRLSMGNWPPVCLNAVNMSTEAVIAIIMQLWTFIFLTIGLRNCWRKTLPTQGTAKDAMKSIFAETCATTWIFLFLSIHAHSKQACTTTRRWNCYVFCLNNHIRISVKIIHQTSFDIPLLEWMGRGRNNSNNNNYNNCFFPTEDELHKHCCSSNDLFSTSF